MYGVWGGGGGGIIDNCTGVVIMGNIQSVMNLLVHQVKLDMSLSVYQVRLDCLPLYYLDSTQPAELPQLVECLPSKQYVVGSNTT